MLISWYELAGFCMCALQCVYFLADVPCSVAHLLNVTDHGLFHLITPNPPPPPHPSITPLLPTVFSSPPGPLITPVASSIDSRLLFWSCVQVSGKPFMFMKRSLPSIEVGVSGTTGLLFTMWLFHLCPGGLRPRHTSTQRTHLTA